MAIKFPIKVDIALSAHKVSLLLQAELGGLDFPVDDTFNKHKSQFQQDRTMVMLQLNRLIRCIVDCQITRQDSISARHALELARSFAARVWDNSPLQLKQLEQIGNVAVRKLANAGINTIETLETTEARRLETVIGKTPPFGMKLLTRVAQVPRLRVSVEMVGREMKPHQYVRIRLRAEVAFLNEKTPIYFRKKPVFVCFLAETSDGQLVEFRRFAASKLDKGQQICFSSELTKHTQYVLVHVMCDEIAGTCRSAELHPNIPKSLFATVSKKRIEEKAAPRLPKQATVESNGSHKRKKSEDFDDGVADEDLLAAELVDFVDVDDLDREAEALAKGDISGAKSNKRLKPLANANVGEPRRLANGNYACSHKCKDKSRCKHLCCQNGTDKPPKPSKKAPVEKDSLQPSAIEAIKKGSVASAKATVDTRQPASKVHSAAKSDRKGANQNVAKEPKSLSKLHHATTPTNASTRLPTSRKSKPLELEPVFPAAGKEQATPPHKNVSDDDLFQDDWFDDVTPEDFVDYGPARRQNAASLPPRQAAHKSVETSKSKMNEHLGGYQAPHLLTVATEKSSMPATSRSTESMKRTRTVSEKFDDYDSDLFEELASTLPDSVPKAEAPAHQQDTFPPNKSLFFTSPEKAASVPSPTNSEPNKVEDGDSGSASQLHCVSQEQGQTISYPRLGPSDPVRDQITVERVSEGVSNAAGSVDAEPAALIEGIDPAFYAEFKDLVEFV